MSAADVDAHQLEYAYDNAARRTQIGGTHYGADIQPWDVIDSWGLNFYAGNILKYLKRYHLKGTPIQDLEKARHYLDKLLEVTRQEVDAQPPPT